MVYFMYGGFVFLALLTAVIAVWGRRDSNLKWLAIAAASIIVGGGYWGYNSLLSLPKPVSMEVVFRGTPQAEVLGYKIRYGEALYLYLDIEDFPYSYVIPWGKDKTKEMADELVETEGEAKKAGEVVYMNNPFGPVEEGESSTAGETVPDMFVSAPRVSRLLQKAAPKTLVLE